MPRPNNIIRSRNDPYRAITLNGREVRREKEIYLPSHRQSFPVLQTSMHFCFRDASQPRGSTLFCTCGSFGEIVGYRAYKHLNAYIGNEVIVCHSYIQTNQHADGSHE
jgi:hypothetical protein